MEKSNSSFLVIFLDPVTALLGWNGHKTLATLKGQPEDMLPLRYIQSPRSFELMNVQIKYLSTTFTIITLWCWKVHCWKIKEFILKTHGNHWLVLIYSCVNEQCWLSLWNICSNLQSDLKKTSPFDMCIIRILLQSGKRKCSCNFTYSCPHGFLNIF